MSVIWCSSDTHPLLIQYQCNCQACFCLSCYIAMIFRFTESNVSAGREILMFVTRLLSLMRFWCLFVSKKTPSNAVMPQHPESIHTKDESTITHCGVRALFGIFLSPKIHQTMLWSHNARVNSHQRWKQTRNRVCFHLWCELTSTMSAMHFLLISENEFFSWNKMYQSDKFHANQWCTWSLFNWY